MSNCDPDFWLRELVRTGLSASDQKELLTSLTKAVADREKYFPQAPSPYLCRVRQFLMAAFLPQKGPLSISMHPSSEPELLSRRQCWQLVHLELSLLDGKLRPVEGVHEAIVELIGLLTSSEFPLTIPPRWLADLFADLERMTALRMDKNGWSLRPAGTLDMESQAYFDAVLRNIENEKKAQPSTTGLLFKWGY